MSLYLVQHAKSLAKDKDPKKGLSQEGIAETERIAQVAKGYAVGVSRIIHSGKTPQRKDQSPSDRRNLRRSPETPSRHS